MDIMQLKDVALELMGALSKSGLGSIELKADDIRIKINARPDVIQTVAPEREVNHVADDIQPAVNIEKESQATPEKTPGTPVRSPMVGTFYASPSPEEPPFVLVGQEVKAGDTLFIIEAMKTMNEVKAPRDGLISRVLSQPGDMIEYNQTVMIIE